MTETKKITFEGRTYEAPIWVNSVGRDENGDVCGYKDTFIWDDVTRNRSQIPEGSQIITKITFRALP